MGVDLKTHVNKRSWLLFFSKIELTAALLKKIEQDGADNSFLCCFFSFYGQNCADDIRILQKSLKYVSIIPQEYSKIMSKLQSQKQPASVMPIALF